MRRPDLRLGTSQLNGVAVLCGPTGFHMEPLVLGCYPSRGSLFPVARRASITYFVLQPAAAVVVSGGVLSLHLCRQLVLGFVFITTYYLTPYLGFGR